MSSGDRSHVDLHVKVLNDRVVELAKARGLDAIVYAPHFTRLPEIEARAARFSDDELLVVPAREVFTGDWRDRKHVLAIGLSSPVPDFITLEGAMAAFERQDAAVLAPHPGFATVSLDAEDLRTYRDQIHAVETYNAKLLPHHNRRAEGLAAAQDLPGFASSYAHLTGSVGGAATAFETRVDIVEDLVTALQSGAPRRIVRRDGAGRWWRTAIEFAHLGWENSYGKVDRLLLSGMEPTHPRHVAYDGHFDDVAVY